MENPHRHNSPAPKDEVATPERPTPLSLNPPPYLQHTTPPPAQPKTRLSKSSCKTLLMPRENIAAPQGLTWSALPVTPTHRNGQRTPSSGSTSRNLGSAWD